MGYTLEGTAVGGDTSKDHTMRINLMKAANPPMSDLDAAFDAVVNACEQIQNRQTSHNMEIPGYVVKKYTTDKNINCTSKFDSGNQFLDNHGFTEGQFTWIYECNNDNAAEAAIKGAWESRSQGFVSNGSRWYDEEHMLGVMAIHESFHPFLIDYCVQLQMHTGAQEHSLGHDIVENNQNMCTPMAASYEDDPDYDFEQSGECGQDYNTDGVTETLSDCTIKAMQDSRDHAYHNGVH